MRLARTLPFLLVSFLSLPLLGATARIAPAAMPQTSPRVASNGFDFLAAWITVRPTGYTSIDTARVASDGSITPAIGRPLDPAPGFPREAHPHGLDLSASRDGYFLSWMSDAGLRMALTDAYGVVMRDVTLPAESTSAITTMTAWNGSTHLVLSGFDGPYTGTIVDDNGNVLAQNIAVGNTHGDFVRSAVTADDGGFLVLSTRTLNGNQAEMYGRRIAPSGAAGEWFLVRALAAVPTDLEVTSDGGRDLIVWSDQFGVWTMAVDARTNEATSARQLTSGPVSGLGRPVWHDDRLWIAYGGHVITLGRDGSISAAIEGGGELAASASRVFAVYLRGNYNSPTQEDVAGRFITLENAGDEIVVSRSLTQQDGGSVASDGHRLLSVWREFLAGGPQVFASMGETEVQVSETGANRLPEVAFNGTNFLVVWSADRDNYASRVLARRISPAGVLLDEHEIDLGDGWEPRVASDGTNWMVVWNRSVGPQCPFGPGMKLHAARVSPGGAVLDTPQEIAPNIQMDQYRPDIAWSGTEYVVAWRNACVAFHSPLTTSIGAARVSGDLSGVRAGTVTPDARSGYGSGSSLLPPRVTATPDSALIAWTRVTISSSATEYAVEYRILGSDRSLLGPRRRPVHPPIAPSPIEGTLVAVAHGADGRLALWSRSTTSGVADLDILYGWSVTPALQKLTSRLIDHQEVTTGSPALSPPAMMMTSRFVTEAGAYRVFTTALP